MGPPTITAGPVGGLVAGGVVAVLFGLAWGSVRASRITVTPHDIAVRGLLTRRRRQWATQEN